jgi:predicted glycoside hydrolase/deacetylase ChbG (UPF0249 family)
MKQLIVTADDVGLHPGMTAGAIRAHREGIVTACSVVANGEAFDDAVARLREVPSLEVGVHLSLVDEKPLTDLRVPKSYLGIIPRYPFMSRAAVERELRAQIEKVLATGLRVTHLNGHQHLHVLFLSIVVRLAEEYAIGYVRVPDAGLSRRLPINALSLLARVARRHARGVRTNDRAIGLTEAGRIDTATLLDLIDALPDGVTELVTHPGIGDTALAKRYAWGYAWDRETDALCDGRVGERIVAAGITLTTPSLSGAPPPPAAPS